jgi:hypothetical protein
LPRLAFYSAQAALTTQVTPAERASASLHLFDDAVVEQHPVALALASLSKYTVYVSKSGETVAQRFQAALALFDISVSMKRQRLKQKHPMASEEQINSLLEAWIQDRPCAPGGDCPGRVRTWPLA